MCFSGYNKLIYEHMFRTVVETNAPICRYGGQVHRGENTQAALQLERLLLLGELADFSVMLGDFG